MDGKKVYDILDNSFPDVLEELSAPGSVAFGGDKIPLVGSIFNHLPNDNIYIRFRYDNLVYFSPRVLNVIDTFLNVLKANCFSFQLCENQGYIVKNGQWLHGRKSFIGSREMYRILLNINDMVPTAKISFGFTPSRITNKIL